jgi:hypothetical protein
MAIPGAHHNDFENKATNKTLTNQYWGGPPVKLDAEIQEPVGPYQEHLHCDHFHHKKLQDFPSFHLM